MSVQQPKAALTIAAIGLLLMNGHGLFGLIGDQRLICNLIGDTLFIYAFWIIGMPHLQKEPTDDTLGWGDWKAVSFTLCALSFLALDRFARLGARPHGIANSLGWFVLFVSFALPKSNWQPTALFAIYAITISQVRWKQFLVFREMQTPLLIALLLIWLAVSGTIYMFLIRRKPATSPSDLN